MPTAASPAPKPPIYIATDYTGTPPDLDAYGFAHNETDPPFLVTNGSIFSGVVVSPENAYDWASTTYAGKTKPTTLMFSHEQEPCFVNYDNINNEDLRSECIHRLGAAFSEIRRAFNNNCQFLLEPYPPNGIFTTVPDGGGGGPSETTTAETLRRGQIIAEILRKPVSGFPNGFFSLFGGLAINLYRRNYSSSSQQTYMLNQVRTGRLTGLPLHMYLSPREAFSASFTAPSGYTGNVVIAASQRVLDVELFAADLDFALRHGDTVTIWDSKFYGNSTADYTSNGLPSGGTGLLNSLAGNWGSGGVTAAAYLGQSGMIAGYGPAANRSDWSTTVNLDWWKHLIRTMKSRGYYTE